MDENESKTAQSAAGGAQPEAPADASETTEPVTASPEAGQAEAAESQSAEGEASAKKRTFKAPKAEDGEAKARRAPAAGPTDDIAEDETERRRYRAPQDTEEVEGGEGGKKKTYRSDIEDYDDDDKAPDAEAVFQYKPGQGGRKRGLVTALVSVAAVALLVVALAVFLPEGNPIAKLYDNLVNSTPLTRGDAVMSIDGEDVSSDMYLHLLLSAKAQIDSYYPGYLEANAGMLGELKTLVENELRSMAARDKLAAELGALADDNDRASVESYLAETKASYLSDVDYGNALTNSYLTEELYRELLLDGLEAQKLYSKASELPEYSSVSAEQAEEYIAANGIVRVKHILLLAPAGTDEGVKAQKLELANKIAGELAAGGDFDELMLEYTEDANVDSSPDGFSFGDGEMVAEFESASKALGIGEVSGVVETAYGYHIIKRLEPDYAALTNQIITERVDAKVSQYAESAQVKRSRGYDKITLEQCVWPYSTETVSSITQPPEPAGEPAGQAEKPADGGAAE